MSDCIKKRSLALSGTFCSSKNTKAKVTGGAGEGEAFREQGRGCG
ncbi:hypothetical protein [Moorena sp. SIO4G3]|nr:hypothetical protein [Moorena sp. SIO4G3]